MDHRPPSRKPDFERLRTALLRLGEPDCVPLYEPAIADNVMSGFLGRPVHDPARIGITLTPPPTGVARSYVPDFVAVYAAAGYDFIPIKFGVGGQVLWALERERPGQTERIRITGEAGSNRTWAAESGGFIHTWADLEAVPWPEPGTVDLSLLDAAAACLPDGMRILAVSGGMLMHARIWMGMEHFWLALGEDPALAVALLRKLQELEIVAIDQATDHPAVGAFLLDDDLAHTEGLLESPKFLREHVFPFYRQVGEIVHGKNLPLVMHTDGKITQVLPDLIACGVDALHPIEPKAMDIAALKRDHGHRLALLGNVDVGTLTMGTPDEVRSEVCRLMQGVAPGGGFAVGSSNSVPDYVPVENYRAMVEASLNYGRYPIALGT